MLLTVLLHECQQLLHLVISKLRHLYPPSALCYGLRVRMAVYEARQYAPAAGIVDLRFLAFELLAFFGAADTYELPVLYGYRLRVALRRVALINLTVNDQICSILH